MRRSGDSPVADADRHISGFLLRSAVVSGWPDLIADGYSAPVITLIGRSGATLALASRPSAAAAPC